MSNLAEKYSSEMAEVAEAARRLAERNYVASHGGNLSYKVDDNVVLITPTKVEKRVMQPEDIVIVSADGTETLYAAEGRRPTGETPMHTRLLHKRPDLNAIVHAHPPALTGFSLLEDEILARPILPEPALEVGPIRSVAYAEPITDALAAEFDRVLPYSNAWLMRNHGVTIGSSEGITRAMGFMDMLEAMAGSVATALSSGRPIAEIPREEVANLENTLSTRNMPRPGDPRVIKSLMDLFFGENAG